MTAEPGQRGQRRPRGEQLGAVDEHQRLRAAGDDGDVGMPVTQLILRPCPALRRLARHDIERRRGGMRQQVADQPGLRAGGGD